MINRIKVRNFLSIKNEELQLRARNVLVGPNMSGKTNLIECLKFLQDATVNPTTTNLAPLQQAFSSRGGFSEVSWKGELDGPITILLEAEITEPGTRPILYRYEFTLRPPEYGHPRVEEERLTVTVDGTSEALLENSASGFRMSEDEVTATGPQNKHGLMIAQWGEREDLPKLSRFWRFINRWRFYHLVPALMRRSNPPGWEKRLFEQGENLSAWLLVLQNYPEEFRRLKQVCRDVLPDLDELLFQPVEAVTSTIPDGQAVLSLSTESAKISVGAAEKPFKRPISLVRMSDGELAFLGVASVILAPEELSPPLLCFEEPENYLHPRLIEVLIELLNQRATEPEAPQIILTTHSPLLIDKLALEDLVVVEKSDGASKFTRPATKKHLKKLLSSREASLGDLWYSGALSGS